MILRRFAIPVLATMVAAAAPIVTTPVHAQAFWQDRGWDEPPQEYNEAQRRGFHDGIEGARHDRDNGRAPDPNNRDEYRHPDIEPGLRGAYRDGFRRGYKVAASHLWGAAPPVAAPPPPPRGDWDDWGMRGLRSDAERSGYREGVEEAREDFRFHRRPDPDDHQEYRNPNVPPELADEYREGFMRGYEVAMSQLNGEGSWRDRDPDRWAMDRFSEVQRRGFHDGMDGARHDFDNHRRPNPANRDEYREPRMPQEFWNEYREGFRRGYEVMATRLWGGM